MQSTKARNLMMSLGLLICAMPSIGMAHEGWHSTAEIQEALATAFMKGLLHPLTGLDHLLAMLAVGVWSAQTTKRVWLAPLAFATLLLVGACVGSTGAAISIAEAMVAVSVIVLGVLVAGRVQLSIAVSVCLVGVFALFHGITHGMEFGMRQGTSQYAILVGMLASTVLLHITGIFAGFALQQSARINRAVGLAIVLLGGGLFLQAI